MKTLTHHFVLVLLFLLTGCHRGPDGVKVTVQVDPSVRASCIAVEMLSSDGQPLQTIPVERISARDTLVIAVYRRESWPEDIQVRARALLGTACNEEPLIRNGLSAPSAVHFASTSVESVTLELLKPTAAQDADGDGFVNFAAEGEDCDDAQALSHPGAPEVCDASADRNCDGRLGCDDATCSSTACTPPPSVLTFSVPASQSVAGQCAAVAVERRDSRGQLSVPGVATDVAVTSALADELMLFSDSSCFTRLGASVAIPARDNSAVFYVKGIRAKTGSLTASASGFMSASLSHTVLAGPVKKLEFTPPSKMPSAGECVPLTVTRSDEFGNPVTVAGQTLALSLSSTSLTVFYGDLGCTTAASEVPFTEGRASVTFFFKSTLAGAVDASVMLSGITQAQRLTVSPGPAAKLFFATTAGPSLKAAECSSLVTVRSLDIYGNLAPVSAATALTLSSTAGRAVAFFSDSDCKSYVDTVSIPAGGREASFRVRGMGGGSVTLTAAATGLLPATQSVNAASAVRRGACTLANGSGTGNASSTVNCPVNPAVASLDKSFVSFQATNSDSDANGAFVQCWLANTSTITCSRTYGGGPVTINWQLVELASGLRVQHRNNKTCTGATTPITIEAVDPSKSFILFSASQVYTDILANDFATAVLKNPTQVDVTLNAGGCDTYTGGYINAYSVQVVEMEGLSVSRGTTGAMTNAVMDVPVTESATAANSLVLATFQTAQPGDSASTKAICNRMIRGEVTGDTTLRFFRGAGGCNPGLINTVSWERITANAHASVQSVKLEISTSYTAAVQPLGTAVDPNRTLLLSSSQAIGGQSSGETTYPGDNIPGVASGRFQLQIPEGGSEYKQVEVVRGTSLGDSIWTVYALQFEP